MVIAWVPQSVDGACVRVCERAEREKINILHIKYCKYKTGL